MAKGVTKIADYGFCKDDSDIFGQIAQGPITTYVSSYNDLWRNYAGGAITRYDDCDVFIYNHMVLIVGWKIVDGYEVFIVKNDWGEDWGENGYAYVDTYRGNEKGVCGIKKAPFYVVL